MRDSLLLIAPSSFPLILVSFCPLFLWMEHVKLGRASDFFMCRLLLLFLLIENINNLYTFLVTPESAAAASVGKISNWRT